MATCCHCRGFSRLSWKDGGEKTNVNYSAQSKQSITTESFLLDSQQHSKDRRLQIKGPRCVWINTECCNIAVVVDAKPSRPPEDPAQCKKVKNPGRPRHHAEHPGVGPKSSVKAPHGPMSFYVPSSHNSPRLFTCLQH